jgi:adenylate cyclase
MAIRPDRRLAAVMALDVVGYTRLMGDNEEGTHERVSDTLRDLVVPTATAYGGRVVKKTGDGAMIEFRSVVEALRCGISVQCAMRERNTPVERESRIEFRVGISLGDVIVEPDDIYGDGVNLAVRLQGVAPAGGIAVAQAVADQVRGHPSFSLEDLGTRTLKNMGDATRVFGVCLPDSLEPWPTGAAGLRTIASLNGRPAIAVLPFGNTSGDKADEYFCDGVTEDVITELGSWRSFPVIARNSAFAYRGATADLRRVGRELGVRYILHGSVRRAGSRVRIFAELIEPETSTQVFAERYDRMLDDVFAIQVEIARSIVGALEPELLRYETERAARAPHSFGAYDSYLRGLWHHNRYTDEDNLRAQRLFAVGLDLDPDFAQAAAALAVSTVHRHVHGWERSHDTLIRRALQSAQRAVSLDSRLPQAMYALALCHLHSSEIRLAIREMEEVIRLHPSHAAAHANLGNLYNYINQPAKAMDAVRTAYALSPNDSRRFIWSPVSSGAYYLLQRYGDAIDAGREGHSMKPDYVAPLRYVVAAMGQLGQLDEASRFRQQVELSDGNLAGTQAYLRRYYIDEDALAHILEGLSKAGIK